MPILTNDAPELKPLLPSFLASSQFPHWDFAHARRLLQPVVTALIVTTILSIKPLTGLQTRPRPWNFAYHHPREPYQEPNAGRVQLKTLLVGPLHCTSRVPSPLVTNSLLQPLHTSSLSSQTLSYNPTNLIPLLTRQLASRLSSPSFFRDRPKEKSPSRPPQPVSFCPL